MSLIVKRDTDGVKPLLQTGELGYDNYPAGGDRGRVYVGTGSVNIPLAKKAEMLAVEGKADAHIARVDNPHEVTKAQVGLGNVDNTADINKVVASAGRLTEGKKINNVVFDNTQDITINVDDIDASKITSGIIDAARLPSYVDDVLEFSSFDDFPLVGETGKIYVAIDTNKTYRWGGTVYVYITSGGGAVDSVAGKTGVVSLAKGDVGLANVDNTSDIDKPISTATQTALNTKVDIETNQTIAGIKTFSSDIAGSITGNAGTATKLETARTINGVAFDGSANITIGVGTSDTTAVKLTGDQTIADVKTFTSSPIVPTPTTNFQVATKQYVDSKTLNINTLTDKPTPVDTDNFALQEVGGALKKVSYKNLIISTNATVVKTALNASGAAPIYACRAWVNFNGKGTVYIRASGNVSSITDNGAGSYTANIITPLPLNDISATAMSSASYNGTFSSARNTNADILSINTTTIKIATVLNNSDRADHTGICISVFG